MKSNRGFQTVIEELKHTLGLLEIEQKATKKLYEEQFLNQPLNDKIAAGKCYYPVEVINQKTGLGDRLILEIEPRKAEQQLSLKPGAILRLFANDGAAVREWPEITGVLVRAKAGKLLLAFDIEELPDDFEQHKLGLEPAFDDRTFVEMKKAVEELIQAKGSRAEVLRDVILGYREAQNEHSGHPFNISSLNQSQNEAVQKIFSAKEIALIHGPPGTGKTTTLVAAIQQCLKQEKQVLVCTASNLAVDLVAERLAEKQLQVLRIGHPARLSEAVRSLSLDQQVEAHPYYADLKKLRQLADAIRKKALKFRRKFGAAERRQRKALLQEAKEIRIAMRNTEKFILKDLLDKAQVICSTLAGAAQDILADRHFSTVFIDEAGQALEPACWIPILKADKVVLAGDHLQLSPTIHSKEAERQGLAQTLFEKAIERLPGQAVMLREQYRMNEVIMGFSNRQFYQKKLVAAPAVAQQLLLPDIPALTFIDTAGLGWEEKMEQEGGSRFNPEEANCCLRHAKGLLQKLTEKDVTLGIISPYKAQVAFLRRQLELDAYFTEWKGNVSIDTIDGFQGQERDIIYISLVRSNEKGEVGFLSDTRRMNVALTRAKKRLVIFGDSATLSTHAFYEEFLAYCDALPVGYQSAWELVEM